MIMIHYLDKISIYQERLLLYFIYTKDIFLSYIDIRTAFNNSCSCSVISQGHDIINILINECGVNNSITYIAICIAYFNNIIY